MFFAMGVPPCGSPRKIFGRVFNPKPQQIET